MAPARNTDKVGNRILDLLPKTEIAAIAPYLTPVHLNAGEILYRAQEPMAHVYFPISCGLSVIAVMEDGDAIEIGAIGREGLSGIQALFGSDKAANQMLCQIPGNAISMPFGAFEKFTLEDTALRTCLRHYAQAFFNFMGQSVACNRLHSLTERCARWLLMTHDRIGSNELSLTQEFLAIMLGCHRPSVSIAANTLQQAGFISFNRGRITIVNREGLESASCECYGAVAEDFNRLLVSSNLAERDDEGAGAP